VSLSLLLGLFTLLVLGTSSLGASWPRRARGQAKQDPEAGSLGVLFYGLLPARLEE